MFLLLHSFLLTSSPSLFTLNLKSAFSLQRIFVSQNTDFHFENYRFSFRKLQIFISQTTDFHFVSLHFVSQIPVSPNPRARQVHDQSTVGQRQSVSACGCCFNFVEYIAVKKKECINQQRKKNRRKKDRFRSRNRTQHHRLHATSPHQLCY